VSAADSVGRCARRPEQQITRFRHRSTERSKLRPQLPHGCGRGLVVHPLPPRRAIVRPVLMCISNVQIKCARQACRRGRARRRTKPKSTFASTCACAARRPLHAHTKEEGGGLHWCLLLDGTLLVWLCQDCVEVCLACHVGAPRRTRATTPAALGSVCATAGAGRRAAVRRPMPAMDACVA
jgi:hypothetical protein